MNVLVGKKAPSFSEDAVINGKEFTENFSLEQYLGKKYVVFFFYPMDFTFVCPTELIAFQNHLTEFEERNTAVVACSTDSKYSHWAWLNTEQNKGGIKGVTYPIVADRSKTIASQFGVLAGEYNFNEGKLQFEGNPVAYRGLFLIDKEGVVRHQVINDLPLGRSVGEALRMVDALRFYEENGEVCPADWHAGQSGMKATSEGLVEYFSNN
ncbi:MAG: peroxiredoxin [Bacteroidetes bacterium]|nr:MAG: peroxiredoxin [Bacteroidetes bacterium OLB10]MBV6454125.1 Alkyl hydroperoxide reductase C [Bacteroidia bacterium]MBX3105614.1 peroxiredoxin [Bacteroidota bacterium]MCB8931179.1 peroxiredoxin [Bacteroidia bacterium]MCO5289061.1 peroxiredoxin [Bacteroidota bacterium]